MIIIFGEKEYIRTRDRGEFFCRSCNGWQPYAYQVRQYYFTFFFIRTPIPTGSPSEYIECLHCHNTFDLTALRYNPDVEYD